MTFNYVDIILVVIFSLVTYYGWKRGLLLTLINFIRYFAGITLCFYISNNSYEQVYNSYVREKAIAAVNEKIVTSKDLNTVFDNLRKAVDNLPRDIASAIDLSKLEFSIDDAAQSITDDVYEPILMMLTRLVIFLIVYIIFFAATKILMKYLYSKRKKHISKSSNSFLVFCNGMLGAAFGAARAVVIIGAVAVGCVYIAGITGEARENSFLYMLQTSRILDLFEDANILDYITA